MPSDKALCDLHIHSTYSDSDATIESIFQAARTKRLRCLALTDHDTMDGIPHALELGSRYDIEFIKGIELSSHKDNIEVHVLGYFGDYVNEKFLVELNNIRDIRKARLLAMVDKLSLIGVRVDSGKLFESIKNNIPTRLHLALYLVDKGYAFNLSDAFRKYLSPGRPGYVARFKYSTQEAIAAIKNAGGVAFLAHPHYIANKEWIDEFAGYGLDGIEVVYPRLSAATMANAAAKAQKLGLLQSGGSDAHGSYKEFTSVGGVEVPYEFAQAIKERLKENCRVH